MYRSPKDIKKKRPNNRRYRCNCDWCQQKRKCRHKERFAEESIIEYNIYVNVE